MSDLYLDLYRCLYAHALSHSVVALYSRVAFSNVDLLYLTSQISQIHGDHIL